MRRQGSQVSMRVAHPGGHAFASLYELHAPLWVKTSDPRGGEDLGVHLRAQYPWKLTNVFPRVANFVQAGVGGERERTCGQGGNEEPGQVRTLLFTQGVMGPVEKF